jgi:hypothetical protein
MCYLWECFDPIHTAEENMKKLCLGSANLFFFLCISTVTAQTAPEAPPAAPPAEPPTAASELTVSEAVITAGIESLTPKGASDSFEANVGKLYAFTKITGAEGETTVKHLWFHGDQLVGEVELPVKAASWRTYSSKTIMPDMTGQWKVDITTHDGTVLKSIPFTIQTATQAPTP